MGASFCIIIYASVFLIIFLVYFCKRKMINSTSFLLAYYAFAGLCSLVFYNVSNAIIRDYRSITMLPFVYLIVCILFSLMPVFKYDRYSPKIWISNAQYNLIDILSYVLAFCSILPFIESLIQLPSTLSNQSSMADIYDRRLSGLGTNDYLSWLGRKFYYIIMLCSLLLPICLFAQLKKHNKNLKVIFCLVLCIVVDALHNMISGGRSGLMQNLLYLIIVFFLFRNHITKGLRRKISLYGSIVVGVSLFAMMMVTLSRFSLEKSAENYDNVFGWLSLYAGEGPLNFCNDLWYVNKTTERSVTFTLFDGLLNNHFLTVKELWALGDRIGVPGNIFYTWIGTFCMDFGKVMSLIIIIFLSLMVSKLIRGNEIGLVSFTFLCIWGKILVVGPIFYAYSTVQSQYEILVCVVFCLFLSVRKR